MNRLRRKHLVSGISNRYNRLFWLIILAAAILTPVHARAWKFKDIFSGYLMAFDYMDLTKALSESKFFVGNYSDKKWFRTENAGLRLQVRLAGELVKDVSFDTSVNFEYDIANVVRDPNMSVASGMSVYFKEGFISARNVLGFMDMKIGRQYVFWGRFEWGGCLDVVSPWDFVHMSAEKENFRVAVDGLRIYFNLPKDFSIEGLVLPLFSPNRMPLDMPAKAGPFDVALQKAKTPDRGIKNMEAGARLHIPLGDAGEMSATYFRGFDRFFSMYVKPDFLKKTLNFTPVYKPLQVVGIDGEFFAGPVNILFESAYFHTADSSGKDIFIKNRHIDVAAGIEWDATSDLFIYAVMRYSRLLKYSRQREYDNVKALGEPDPYVARTNKYSMVYQLRYMALTNLSVHLMQSINFLDWDFMTLAFISWEARTGLKLYAGTVFFRGKAGTTFGRLEPYSRLFFELRYSF